VNEALLNSQLRDIQGLDAISAWPPAPGWWLMLAAVLLAFIVLSLAWNWFKWRRRMPRGSWQQDASRQLYSLRKRIDRGDTKQLSAELFELMRRIAMARCGRRCCAGLSGERWLNWLAQHDPQGFDWPQYGKAMLEGLYAPAASNAVRATDLHQIVNAALGWTTQPLTCDNNTEMAHGV